MLPTVIAMIAIVAVIVLWVIMTQHKLAALDRNIGSAMGQIGVQLSNRSDALLALLNLTKGHAKHESKMLIETFQSRRIVITAKSTPDDVQCQERLVSGVLSRIAVITEQYPELRENKDYIKMMEMMQNFQNKVCICRLIYNDDVTKLNRAIRKFPVFLIAGILGFEKREYLVDQNNEAKLLPLARAALSELVQTVGRDKDQ